MISALVAISSLPVRMEAATLTSVLSDIETILTKMFSWIGQVFTSVTDNPILFLLVMGSFGLICIGIVKRLINIAN